MINGSCKERKRERRNKLFFVRITVATSRWIAYNKEKCFLSYEMQG